MEEIDLLRQAEETNYAASRERLRDTAELTQETVNVYQVLFDLVGSSGIKPRDEIVAGGMFLGACRYQLVVGSLMALRGHGNDSHFFTRRAVELCAFAYRIKNDPQLAMDWLQAWRDAASYKQFRKDFSTKELFPTSHPLLNNLYKRYDLSSKLVHSSIYGFGRNIQTTVQSGWWQITFSYCELNDQDLSEPAGTLLYIVDTHFGILRVFEEVLADVIIHNKDAWQNARNALDSKLGYQKAKWKSVLPT